MFIEAIFTDTSKINDNKQIGLWRCENQNV